MRQAFTSIRLALFKKTMSDDAKYYHGFRVERSYIHFWGE